MLKRRQHESVLDKLGMSVGFAGLFFVMLLMGLAVGCSKEGDGEGGGEGAIQTVIHTYTTRGRIVSLPEPGNPASEFRVHHEAIDDFRHADDSPAPMKSMTMPYPLGPGVSLEDLAVGDVVEFTFDVQWEPSPGMGVTAIKKLPAETELLFEQESDDAPMHHGEADEHAGH